MIYFASDWHLNHKAVLEYESSRKVLGSTVEEMNELGNHDHFSKVFYFKFFESVKTYDEIKYKDRFFILFHYPIVEWNGKFHGSIHIHGHLHSREIPCKNRFNACLEVNNFKPIPIESILEKVECCDI